MNSLGNERENWETSSQKLIDDKESLLGDMLLSTGFITYLGSFEGIQREKIVKQ